MMCIRNRAFEYFVSSIGAAYTDKQVIIASEIGCYLSFPFAPILAAHYHINPASAFFAIEAQVGSHSNQDVFFRTAVRVYDDVSDLTETVHKAFSRI